MTAGSVTPDQVGMGALPSIAAEPPTPADNAFLAGNPAALGVPVFIAGSVGLGLTLMGYVPAGAVGAPIAVIAAATGIGLTIATIWAVAVGQSAVASVFGIFAGFWLSYAALVLGLLHDWYKIPADGVTHTQGVFLISWMVVIGMLTLSTLRLPLAFTAIFLLVEIALASILVGTINASTGWLKLGGLFVFAFAAVGVYVYYSIASTMTGGPEVSLGAPVIKS